MAEDGFQSIEEEIILGSEETKIGQKKMYAGWHGK